MRRKACVLCFFCADRNGQGSAQYDGSEGFANGLAQPVFLILQNKTLYNLWEQTL